jgi:WD40 repeat protein/predicted Ser/Thr protein kinase
LPIPTLLNQRYRVLHELGAGGQGAVYQVEDTKLANRLLAAKKLQSTASLTSKQYQEAIDAFQREAEMLANLNHSSLPEIYDRFEENSGYYIIMQLIAGKTLEDVGQQRLPITEILQTGIKLAIVLDYLHTRQPAIIFRDLKPDNIMITPEGQIYLIDFGIARHFKSGQSKDTIRMGLPGYVSPELLFNIEQTTPAADIYSLGAVLYELFSGKLPDYKSPIHLRILAKAPDELCQLVMDMLAFDKNDRPSSMAFVKQRLENILQNVQQSGRNSSASKSHIAPQQQKPQLFQGTLTAQTTRSAPPTRILPKGSVPQKPLPPLAPGELLHTSTHHSGAIYALVWSPDGSKLASAGEDCQVCVWQALTGKTIFTYQKHTGSVRALAWSPNSKYVASAGNDHTVQIWQAQDGQSFSTYQGHRRWVQALSWSPDAKLVASGDANGQVHLWNPRTGQQHLTYQQHHASIYALSFSPDGTLLASGDEDGAIHIWESAGLSLRALCTIHQRKISALAWSPDGTLIASSSEDRKDHALHIWRATTGTQVAAYAAHQRMVNALAWSPANKRLASAGRDQTVQILDPQTGNTLFTYRGHTSSINALAWSPDGNTLASAGDERAVQVWWAN